MVCKQKSHIFLSLSNALSEFLHSIGCRITFYYDNSIKQTLEQVSISDHNGVPKTLLLSVFAKPLAFFGLFLMIFPRFLGCSPPNAQPSLSKQKNDSSNFS